ncbi:MAG: response regulator, partial [Gemmataceae bacterium]
MIQVLVADDSPTARALLVEIIRSDRDLVVAAEARNGREAVELAKQLRPGLITMDIHMPVMDGLAATKEIMIEVPTPIVLVTGSQESREVEIAMNALRVGAVTVLRKPPGPGSAHFDEEASTFLRTIKAMADVKVVRHWRTRQPAPRVAAEAAVDAVVIATSTGGPAALYRLLEGLPADLPAP